MQKVASQHKSALLNLMSLSLSQNLLLVIVLPLKFHTEDSPIIKTYLNAGATFSAMSYTDVVNILQSGEVDFDSPGRTIRL